MLMSDAGQVRADYPHGSAAAAAGDNGQMIARLARPRYRVNLEIPRTGSMREWGAAAAGFERRLAAQESQPVITARVESEARRGRDYVRIRISVTVDAADIGQAAVAAWGAFREAVGEDATGWDMADASAEIRPADKARLMQRSRQMRQPAGPGHTWRLLADSSVELKAERSSSARQIRHGAGDVRGAREPCAETGRRVGHTPRSRQGPRNMLKP